DGFPLISYLKGFPIKAFPVAGFAIHINIRQKIHLYDPQSASLTGFAPSSRDVKTKSSRFVSPNGGFLGLCEEGPYFAKDTGIGGRVGSRCASDRGLIDFDDLVYMLQPGNFLIGHRFLYPVKIIGVQDGVEG